MTGPRTGPDSPTVGELRGQIRSWRRGRAQLSWGELISETYIVGFSVLVFGSMLVGAVRGAGAAVAGCETTACQGARAMVPVLVGLGVLTLAGAVIGTLGPVVASRASASVLLATPLPRRAWLRRQYLTGTLGSGSLTGSVLFLAAVLAGWSWAAVGALTLLGAAVGAWWYVAGTLAQASGTRRWRPVSVWLPGGLLTVLLIAIALGGGRGLAPPTAPWWWLPGAVAATVGVVTVPLVERRLGAVARRDLTRGHGLARGLAGALSGLDPALAYDVVLQQQAARRPRVRTIRTAVARWRGPAALVTSDLVRLRRWPGRLIPLAATVVVPYAMASVGAGPFGIPVTVVVAFLAAVPLAPGLRVLGRTPSMSRLLGHPPRPLRLAALAVPAVVLTGYGLAVAAAMPGSAADAAAIGVAVGVGGLASLGRWLLAAPPDYSRPLVSTPMGGVPTNLYGSAARGFDVALLISVPMLFAPTLLGAAISLVISGITVGVLVTRTG